MNVSSSDTPLLKAVGVSKSFGGVLGCRNVDLDLLLGEVLGIVGESGSGKSTLLRCLSGEHEVEGGHVNYALRTGETADVHGMGPAQRRMLMRTDWAFIHQNPRDGLRMGVSAGGNVGERLMAIGDRHYGNIRNTAIDWLEKVEMSASRIDHMP